MSLLGPLVVFAAETSVVPVERKLPPKGERKPFIAGKLEHVRLVGKTGGAAGKFTLTEAAAAVLLKAAIKATNREIHDFYNVGDYAIHGTASLDGKPVTWEIREGGVMEIASENRVRVWRLVDPGQWDDENLQG